MNQPPPVLRDQTKVDRDHLRLLQVFHYVLAGLALLGLGFLALHYGVMRYVLTNPELMKKQTDGPPPAEIFALLQWFYWIGGGLCFAMGTANLASGLFIRRRINRLFSIIIAGINCIQIPFGTALGIFTIVVLMRDSVRVNYAARDIP
jgi:hypothetical protein